LVKSPSISTQQQKQFHKQQLQNSSTNNSQHSSSNPNSSSLKQQQPLLITPKLHQLEANGQELLGLDGIGNSPLVACMPPSSQFRPIPHKSIMPAHEPPHHHNHSQQSHPHQQQQQQQHPGTLLNPSTAMLSSKFFTAPTLPK